MLPEASGLSERDKRALQWGGAAIAILLLYLLLRGGGSGPPAEPVQPDVPATMPAGPPPVVAVAAPVAVVPAADVSQLRLFGLLSHGAVIGMADGTQRFIPIGREIVPGVTLRGVEVHHAILATGSGQVRLGFDGVAQQQAAAAPPAAAPAASAEAAQRGDTLRYTLGLAPRTVGRRISGYTIRPGASLPALDRAGLQPGDLILRVNGSELGEEQMQNLAWQIANSDHMEFEIERGGRPMRLTAPAH